MAKPSKLHQVITLTHNLESPEPIREKALLVDRKDQLDILRAWQARRLTTTYTDLLTKPRYTKACRFFLDDVYAAKDFRQRDEEIRHLYEIIHHFLPDILLKLVKTVIELNDLTNTLDEALWSAMYDELGVTDTITVESYAAGYRICDNYAERAHQIELIDQVGHMVDFTTKIPMISTTLKIVRGPVSRAGWHDLHSWIERGFFAFRHMHGAKEFLATIHNREMTFLKRIFASDPQPFRPYIK
jgi:hypothetical protein